MTFAEVVAFSLMAGVHFPCWPYTKPPDTLDRVSYVNLVNQKRGNT